MNSKDEKEEFRKSIKVDISETDTKKREFNEFIKQIEDDPNIINKLSNDRLDKLINYYEKITKEKQLKIEKLKNNINQ